MKILSFEFFSTLLKFFYPLHFTNLVARAPAGRLGSESLRVAARFNVAISVLIPIDRSADPDPLFVRSFSYSEGRLLNSSPRSECAY